MSAIGQMLGSILAGKNPWDVLGKTIIEVGGISWVITGFKHSSFKRIELALRSKANPREEKVIYLDPRTAQFQTADGKPAFEFNFSAVIFHSTDNLRPTSNPDPP